MPAAIPIGAHGQITYTKVTEKPVQWKARTKYRHADNVLREVTRFGPTKGAVTTAMDQALLDLAKEHLRASNLTVGEMARRWADQLDENKMTSGTIRQYRQQVTKHIEPEELTLSRVALADLTVDDCATHLETLVKSTGYATAKTVRSCLQGCLDLAVRRDLMRSNPVRAIPRLVPPRASATKREVKPTDPNTKRSLKKEERDRLVAYVDADEWAQRMDLADLIAFLAGTGVRIGEALALSDDLLHLDGDRPTATICHTMVRVPGRGLWRQPWTKGGEGSERRDPRVLALPAWLAERLRERRNRPGYFDAPEGVVFPSPHGRLRDPSNTSTAVKKLYVAADYPWATSHTFRRTVNNLLRDAGYDGRDRAKILGHSRPETTEGYDDQHHPVEGVEDVL